jgi:hypothetical protein
LAGRAHICRVTQFNPILMKTIKIIFLATLLLLTEQFYAQQDPLPKGQIELKELGISVSEFKDLKTIEWTEIFDMFELYGEGSEIKVYLQLKEMDLRDRDNKSVHFADFKVSVKGTKAEREKLQAQMEQITNKLIEKYSS